MSQLIITDHSRDSAAMTYIYPVISRRSGGLSIGVNLNPNNACNWRCIYCQVPDLIRGAAPVLDLARLETELRRQLEDALHGDFYERYQLPAAQRVIRDIAIAGNGEPTGSPAFAAAIGVIGQLVADYGLFGQIKLVLISNGSLMHKPEVQRGLTHWAELGGEIWFKVDSATEEGIYRINSINLTPEQVLRNLKAAAGLCPTWIQTCLFAFDGQPPSAIEQRAYLDFLGGLPEHGIQIEGVLLYGLARPSHQPEAERLHALPAVWLEDFGRQIEALGVRAKVHV